ncbi:MAG: tetratricopeptide repeat protein [Myxococcota bacterium]
MSLLKRMFKGRTPEEELEHAAELMSRGDHGRAKLGLEKALAKTKDVNLKEQLQNRIHECCDALAKERIAEARRCIASDSPDLARNELQSALEVAVDVEIRSEAQGLIDELESHDAVEKAHEVEISDEERLAALGGSWEPAQDEEYGEYGDAFGDALLQVYDGKPKAAIETFEALLDEAEEPRYLWFETGRAYFELQKEDFEVDPPAYTEDEATERGEEALRAFLDCLEEDEGGQSRLTAHLLLARLAEEREDVEAAIAELERAAEALDDDPRPLLELGRYLRQKERPDEAVEVLQIAADMGDGPPSWVVLQELGLAHRDNGNDERARETLEAVIEMFSGRRSYDFPPAVAVPLAELHEKHEKYERAADLYRALTEGSDKAGHIQYHLKAGVLLGKLDLGDEAQRMLKRAAALGEDRALRIDEELQKEEVDAATKTALEDAREKLAELRTEVDDALAELAE